MQKNWAIIKAENCVSFLFVLNFKFSPESTAYSNEGFVWTTINAEQLLIWLISIKWVCIFKRTHLEKIEPKLSL